MVTDHMESRQVCSVQCTAPDPVIMTLQIPNQNFCNIFDFVPIEERTIEAK